MDAIIADQMLVNTKTYIQEHVQSAHLTDEVKNKFIELYNSVTVNNASAVYAEVSYLYDTAIHNLKREFDMQMFKFAGQLIVGGVVVYGIGRVVKYFNIMPEHNYNFDIMAGAGVVSGVILFFSIGIKC